MKYIEYTKKQLNRNGVRQFIKFCMVGFVNTLLDWLVFYFLKHTIAPPGQSGKQIAKAGSFICSGLSSYILNRRWTFRSTDSQVGRQAARFFAVAGVGLLLNNTIFYIVTAPQFLKLPDIAGLIIATLIVMFWNFTMNKRWTFK